MNSLNIKYIPCDLDKFEEVFLREDFYLIDKINWKNFSYLPRVKFKMFYTNDFLLIKYYVEEKDLKALRTEINSQVYKDSCVEFFVNPGEGRYYNFEFNAIGTPYLGSGFNRETGKTMGKDVTSKIETYPSLGRMPITAKGEISWDLTVKIPLGIFTCKKGAELHGTSMRCNLYKCGDELNEPHYVTWNKIETENPDFHRPEFFGIINFI